MQETLENLTFTVSLGLSAHAKAEETEQIYLNSLAVYTVNFYLQLLQFETELNDCDSEATVKVKKYGEIECIPVLLGAKVAHISPAAIGKKRLGYVVVQLNEELTEGTLLGFVDQVTQAELSLDNLISLDYFSEYIDTIKIPQPQLQPVEKEKSWLEKFITGLQSAGWEYSTASTYAFSGAGFNNAENVEKHKARKKINLAEGIVANIWINFIYNGSDFINLSVELKADTPATLPSNLELALVSCVPQEKILIKDITNKQYKCFDLKPYKVRIDCCVKIKITLAQQEKPKYIELPPR